MKTLRQAVLLAAAFAATGLQPQGARAQADQRAVARQLLGHEPAEWYGAMAAVHSIGPKNAGPELRGALIAALERTNTIHTQRWKAGRRGERLGPLRAPEFRLMVSRAVAKMEDPAAIPALAGALGTGSTVVRALAGFGEPAVPAVLAVVAATEDGPAPPITAGLTALRFMVDRADVNPLSRGTLERIRRAAKQRLFGRQSVIVLWAAIDLAVALDDPELRRIVHSLATDRAEVIARGVTDPDLIEKTQKRAADRLSGIPPLPRWH